MPETRTIEGQGWRANVRVNPTDPVAGAPTLMPTHGEYPIYDAGLYDPMTQDTERNWRFSDALDRSAKDRVVLDIGTGAYLFWAREALRAGARGVVALESMQDSYQAATRTLTEVPGGERITLLHGASTELSLEARAEVCVAEIIGSLASAEGAAAVIADARRRHLSPDAVVIPDVCLTRAAAASLTDLLGGQEPAFASAAAPQLTRIFDWNGAAFDVRLRIANPARDGVMSDHAPVERLDFNGELRPEQESQFRLTIDRPGQVDGLLTWLVISCLAGQEPLDAMRHETNWASIYLPLFDTPVRVEPGDVMDITFRCMLSEDRVHPDYDVAAELHTARGLHHAQHFSPYRGQKLRVHPVYESLFPA